MSSAPPSLAVTRDEKSAIHEDEHHVAFTNSTVDGAGKVARTASEALFNEEVNARKNAKHNPIFLILINGYSAVTVFALHLISLEGLVSIALCISLTISIYHRVDDNSTFDGSIMNWTLLSFAIITPLSAAVSMAFRRREQALSDIANIRATSLEIYAAHAGWDWGWKDDDTGRDRSTVNWIDHSDKVLVQFLGLSEDLTRWLTLPTTSRARHKVTPWGNAEAQETRLVAMKLYESIVVRFGHLADLCEILKREGLPPNEATRIRQYERFILSSVERLRMVKMYRTPQALRSFARLFSVFLPPFYSPFYAQMATELNSLGMAVAFAVLTSVALTALFETVAQMEDPFVDLSVLDGVAVKRDLMDDFKIQILAMRRHFFSGAPAFREKPGHVVRVEAQISTVRLLSE